MKYFLKYVLTTYWNIWKLPSPLYMEQIWWEYQKIDPITWDTFETMQKQQIKISILHVELRFETVNCHSKFCILIHYAIILTLSFKSMYACMYILKQVVLLVVSQSNDKVRITLHTHFPYYSKSGTLSKRNYFYCHRLSVFSNSKKTAGYFY